MAHIGILGSGSWGTAIAFHLANQGYEVRLWARDPALAEEIQQTRQNSRYLPGFELPVDVLCSGDMGQVLAGATTAYFVVPSHGLRDVASVAAPLLDPQAHVVAACKGIENSTLQLMNEVLSATLRPEQAQRLCALGGPSFAREVAAGMPTAVCVASADSPSATRIQAQLNGERLRVYTTDDLIGLELGGALKNVIAIAVGASDGLGFGYNARAALITRGIAEITRLAVQLGANPQTLAGLGGLGDLVLTCTGDLSRNRRVGLLLGQGMSLEEVMGQSTMVAEGVRTARSAHALGQRVGVEMPITREVYLALYEGKAPTDAVSSLLQRALRPERDQ